MAKYLHKGGGAHGLPNNEKAVEGDVVETDDPLDELFPDKFELIPEPTKPASAKK